MGVKQIIGSLVLAVSLYGVVLAHAAPLAEGSATSAAEGTLRAGVTQPYVVRRGDTLWDIANHFFHNPRHWVNIWEHNLNITNPDLIYPGNKIWFDGHSKQQGGLTRVQPRPQVIIRPVERMEAKTDASVILTALQRHGFIQPDQVQGVGYVLDSRDDRLNYGVNDHVYLKLNQPAAAGSLFDVYRSGEQLRDPENGQQLGVLIQHMGQVKVLSQQGDAFRAVVTRAFEEISRGDRLRPVLDTDLHITPRYAARPISGHLIYIRHQAHEAGQNQVVGLNLGASDGVTAGLRMTIYQAGRLVQDKVSGGQSLLPEERIGDLLVLRSLSEGGSIGLITRSTAPVHIGDAVHSSPQP